MGYAFISYSSKNQESADAMRELLKSQGIETWMAPNDIPAGFNYAQMINKAVKECSCFVMMLSNEALKSTWVAKEVERAINYHRPIIPVQIEDVVLNDEFELYISTDQIVPVKKIDADSKDMKKVLNSINRYLGNIKDDKVPEKKYPDEESIKSKPKRSVDIKYLGIVVVIALVLGVGIGKLTNSGGKETSKKESENTLLKESENNPIKESEDTSIKESDNNSLNNPKIKEDSSMKAGQKVTYDCVWFGSYPQTEIVDDPSTSVASREYWARENDYEVDPSLYEDLLNASDWDSNDNITLNNIKYHRVLFDENDNPYHFFRFDPIKWRVLQISDDRIYLLADQTLDNLIVEEEDSGDGDATIVWQTDPIRSWLNGYGPSENVYGADYSKNNFFDCAFSSAEQEAIQITSVSNGESMINDIDCGEDTKDKVFLLSDSEICTGSATIYGFSESANSADEARRCKCTSYARAMGTTACTNDNESLGNCSWWLSTAGQKDSPSENNNAKVSVDEYGHIELTDYYDYYWVRDRNIRPALSLDPSTTVWSYAGIVCTDGTESPVDPK